MWEEKDIKKIQEEILMKNVDEKMVDHIWRVNKDHLDEMIEQSSDQIKK